MNPDNLNSDALGFHQYWYIRLLTIFFHKCFSITIYYPEFSLDVPYRNLYNPFVQLNRGELANGKSRSKQVQEKLDRFF